MSRALMFAGAGTLKVDDPPGCPGYACYEIASRPGLTYNLAQTAGFMDWLRDTGFARLPGPATTAPLGALVIYQAYGAPALSLGGGRCTSHTPLVNAGPHCNVNCSYLAPTGPMLKGIYMC